MSREEILTALCGGGTSEPKPGFNPASFFTPSAVGGVISTIVAEPAAGLIAAVVATQAPSLDQICATDPPADPNVGPLDLIALANPADSQTYFPAVAKFEQWWLRILWEKGCQCTSVDTPALPAPSSPGPANSDPGLGGGNGQGACYDSSTSVQVPLAANGSAAVINGNDLLPGNAAVVVTPVSTGGITEALTLPPNISEVTVNFNGTGTGFAPSAYIMFFNSTGANVGGFNYGTPSFDSNSPFTFTRGPFAVPAGATSWQYIIDQFTPATCSTCGTWQWTTELSYTCTGNPNAPITPCCPPDNSTQIQLNHIYQLLVNLSTQVPQTVPPGYTRSTVHQNITGTGTLTVSGLFGMLAELTSGVPTTPELPGMPPYQFSVGWMSVLTGDGMIDEIRLTRQAQVWAPALMPYATTFGYQLNEGFTATFTELVPATSAAPARR